MFKRFLYGIAGGTLACTVIFSAAAQAASKTALDVSQRTVNISGNADTANEIVNMELIRKGINPISVSPDMINLSKDIILRSVQSNKDGSFDGAIRMNKDFPCGRYILYLDYGTTHEETELVIADTEMLSKYISAINSASRENLTSVISTAVSESWSEIIENEYISEIAAWLYSRRPTAGYSAEAFVKEYMRAEVFAKLRADAISLDTMLERYKPYIEVPYEEIEDLSSKVREDADKLLKSYDLGTAAMEKSVYEALLCARVKNAESVEALKGEVINYYKRNSMDMSIYNSIETDYYKNEVFRDLYAKKSSITTEKQLDRLFRTASETQKANEDKKNKNLNNSQTGGGGGYHVGGSSGSGGGAYGGGTNNPSETGKEESTEIFDDIKNHWAYDDIIGMYQKGIVSGYGDGSFRPDSFVTRTEFSKMVVVMNRLTPKQNDLFLDVSTTDWFAPYVGAAAENGLIQGYNGYFMSNENISREEAVVIIDRMLGSKGETDENIAFDDYADVSGFAADAVKRLAHIGILQGDNGNLYPKNDITRAEAVALLCRVEVYI